MGRWSRRLAEPFLDFVGAAAGETILGVGGGPGSPATALASRCEFARLLGVDFSSIYVAHAVRHCHDPRVTFAVGDVCALDLPERSFDRVLALLVLHFVPRTEQAISEMRRVAKPGAVVGAAVWDARGGFVANRLFFDTAAALDPQAAERWARNYTRPLTRPGELGAAWRAAGFDAVAETTLMVRMEFASFDDCWAPYEGKDGPAAQYMATLNANVSTRLRDAVPWAYLDGEPDGARSYTAVAWAVKGLAPG